MGLRHGVMVVLFLLAVGPAAAQRLPGGVAPTHYDLAFVVDLEHERFDGTETIRVEVAEPTSRIVVNEADITFRDVTIGAGDDAAQTAAFTVARRLAKGPADIHIKYSGVLNSQLRGFYISRTKARK